MQNIDFVLRGAREVLKPKRDEDGVAQYDDDGKVIKEPVEVLGVIRGRILVDETSVIIVNETGEEVGKIVVTDGVLDLVEGEADPDRRRTAIGLHEPVLPEAHMRSPQELGRAEAELGREEPEPKPTAPPLPPPTPSERAVFTPPPAKTGTTDTVPVGTDKPLTK